MKTVFVIALIGAACAFPKVTENPQFKRIYVDPLKPISEKVIPRIINGREAIPHSIPYQAYIIVTGENGRWLCSGSLISPNYVLTAAHCVIDGVSAEVYLGSHNILQPESTRVIVTSYNLTAHKDYGELFISNDIGLIKLPTPVELDEDVNVVSLPGLTAYTNYEGRNARVSGWGLTIGGGTTSQVLMEVNSTVISNDLCNSYYGIVEESQICLSGVGGVGPCNGDSGGPLVLGNEQIGITSYGVLGCPPDYPSGFTRIASYLDWIEQHTDLKF
ncbi:hypothetical protein NQ314_016129 [Rhamnusium bicolor]|uniref:Peptidase S1 domain-containing protein n=1 Tax=Rhamnusium bicolor TaxID=1586634 RepID=A0AAV8WX49_9CUCU|nr:hypothetical protein NQ314_016129 [Rhamnusium bicolor]